METKNETVDPLKGMTKEQRAELLARLQTEAKNDRMAKRESYEALRGEFMHDVLGRVENLESEVSGFKKWLDDEVTAFTKLMREYGAVKNESQQSYTITDGDFKLEVKFNKVKGFDERADLAAERLAQCVGVDLVAVLIYDVHHVDRSHYRNAKLYELCGQVEVTLEVGTVDDVQNYIGALAYEVVSCYYFLKGVG